MAVGHYTPVFSGSVISDKVLADGIMHPVKILIPLAGNGDLTIQIDGKVYTIVTGAFLTIQNSIMFSYNVLKTTTLQIYGHTRIIFIPTVRCSC